MKITIAISGKGGSGKTTIAAMIIKYLLDQRGKGAILTVDADPNSCLGLTLGVQPNVTIADLREEARNKPASNIGMDRLRMFEYGIQQAITEATGFDLLTMGRPEGPDCYCAVNNMLRKFLDQLSSQYQYVIIDNEAGMEHLSRRTTNNVDLLCIVAEPTPMGVVTSQRIFALAKHLPISVKQIGVVWNRSKNSKEIDGIDIPGYVPYDKVVFDGSMQGKSIFDLEKDNPTSIAIRKILEERLRLVARVS